MEETLLEKLGGETGVHKIVDEFYKRALEDPRIKNRYNTHVIDDLKKKDSGFLISIVKKETVSGDGFLIPTNPGYLITKHEFNLVANLYEEAAKDQGASGHTASQLAEALTAVRNDIEGH
jgi:truncated hemoglobin YjbI